MTWCDKRKRRVILAMLAAGVVFSAGHISGTDAYAEELGVDTVQQETASDAADSTADETVSDTLGSTGDETASDTLGSTGDETAADVLGGTAGETASDSTADETASDASGSTADATASDTLGSTASDAGKDTAQDVSEEEVRNGWYEVDGATYYYVDDEPVRDTIMEVDGVLYGFQTSRKLYTNTTFSLKSVEDNVVRIYRAGANGVLYASQWYKTLDSTGRNLWYYYTENGSAATGMTAANITDTRRSRERIITLIHIPGS